MSDISIKKALDWAFSLFEKCSDSALLDAEILLQHVLKKRRSYLFAWPEKKLSKEEVEQFESLVQQRVKGKPIAHIIGVREFWSLEFLVNDTTLIPRPDTEILVESALELCLPSSLSSRVQVLDLGTGTGAIALSLANEKPNWQVTAVDKIVSAVELAKQNQQRLELDNVNILLSDWFSAVADMQFDLIVSNPPYIDKTDEHLAQGDVRFEPLSALVAQNKGYGDLFYIADIARQYLKPAGYLLMEHGYQQGDLLRKKMRDLNYQSIQTKKDFGNNERCTLGQWIAE